MFSYYYMTLTLQKFCFFSLGWQGFSHQDLHLHVFSLKMGFCLKVNHCDFKLYVLCCLDKIYRNATESLAYESPDLFL